MKFKAPKVLLPALALALGAGIAVTLALFSASRQGAPPTPSSLAPTPVPLASPAEPVSASPPPSVARFPTHVDLVTEDSAGPTREFFPKAREIPVTGSTELGCSTKFAEPYLLVDCGPGAQHRTPRDLAIVRGIVTKTWVTADHLGFIARLEPDGGVTVGLGWDEFSRVMRIDRPKGKHGLPRGEVLTAERLIVMASEEDEPKVHYFGFELDHEIEYTVIIQRDGCSRRVLRGSVVGGYPDPLGNAEPRDIGDVEQYGRPGGPISYDPIDDRAYAELEEWYEARPAELEERCLASSKPPLRGRLWPLRPGDAPNLQPIGFLPVPSKAEFDRAHPRALTIRGADAHGCDVSRVRNFFRLRCEPDAAFGAARGVWLAEGTALEEKRSGRRLELVLRTSKERRVSGDLIWEKASLSLSAFASKISSWAGSIEPSISSFYVHQSVDQAILMRAAFRHFAAEPAPRGYPAEVRDALDKPELWTVVYDLVAEGKCAQILQGSAEAGNPWEAELIAEVGKVQAASASARHYYGRGDGPTTHVVALEPGGAAIWFRQLRPATPCLEAPPQLRKISPQKVLELKR